jgi:hypothetical protein
MSLQIIADPTPVSSITLPLASIGPQSRLFQSFVGGSLEHGFKTLGVVLGFLERT